MDNNYFKQMLDEAHLEITSYDFGYGHYYGVITKPYSDHPYKRHRWEVTALIDAETAALYNSQDNHDSYKEGDMTSKFMTAEEVREHAVEIFKTEIGVGILFEGNSAVIEPMRIVHAFPPFAESIEQLNELWQEFEDAWERHGYWQKTMSSECREISKRWHARLIELAA